MRSGWFALGWLAVSAWPASALADDDAEAKRLFEDGRTALAAGRVGQACEAFAAAKKLAPSACGVVQNLASCRQQQGRDRDAYAEYDALIACGNAAKQPDRVKFAEEQRASLRSKLAFLVVTSSGGPAIERLYLDGQPLDGPLDKPRVVEPGKHRVEVERSGCNTVRLEVDTLAGQSQSLVLPAQCDAEAQTTSQATPAQAPVQSPSTPTPEPHRPVRWQLPVGWAAVGVGALAVVGSVAPCGVIALNQKDTDPDAAKRTAPICTGLGIAGGAVAIAGVVLLLTAPARPAPASRYVQTPPRWVVAPRISGAKDWSLSAAVQF